MNKRENNEVNQCFFQILLKSNCVDIYPINRTFSYSNRIKFYFPEQILTGCGNNDQDSVAGCQRPDPCVYGGNSGLCAGERASWHSSHESASYRLRQHRSQ